MGLERRSSSDAAVSFGERCVLRGRPRWLHCYPRRSRKPRTGYVRRLPRARKGKCRAAVTRGRVLPTVAGLRSQQTPGFRAAAELIVRSASAHTRPRLRLGLSAVRRLARRPAAGRCEHRSVSRVSAPRPTARPQPPRWPAPIPAPVQTVRTLMHPLILEHQITPKTSRYTRCSMSMLPNVSINGRIRSSGQLGRWWYSISPCRNSECVRRFTVFAFNQRS